MADWTPPPLLLDAALLYVSWDWPVFPCKPGTKEPATPRGFKDATTDEKIIRKWWERSPWANIATPTGHTFDVLDVDTYRPDATEAWDVLRTCSAMPSILARATTPHDGQHVFLRPSGGGNFARGGPFELPGLDYRGVGGYVLLAPSLVDDKPYTWCTRPDLLITKEVTP